MNVFHAAKCAAAVLAAAAASFLAGCNDSSGNDSPPAPPNLSVKHIVLTGAQENPSVTTPAAGTGTFTLNLDTGEIVGTVQTVGLTGTVAHIHEGAVGVNAPVIVPLTQTATGVWTIPAGTTLTAAQRASWAAGNLYMNVHSAANPGGEIRAQIGRQIWFATLTGAQETPPVTTTARGVGRFIYNPDDRTLSGTVTTTDISGNAAHLHTQVIGTAGPVTFPMTGGPSTWTLATVTLTEAQAADLQAGRLYANVHTTANPGGEIRGQLYQPTKFAFMNGANEAPPNNSQASGTCWVSVNPTNQAVSGRIEFSGFTATNAHVHTGTPGVAGPVAIPMSSPSAGVWVIPTGVSISDATFARFMEGNTYCNVHSAAFPGGEIRGHLNNVF